MNKIQKRFILFLFGCITTRLYIAYFAKKSSTINLKYMGYIALLPAFGFLYIFFTKSRMTGLETMGDEIWWNNLRPIHSFLYLLFAYYAINGNKQSWKILLLDVVIGLISFLIYHKNANNFDKLIY